MINRYVKYVMIGLLALTLITPGLFEKGNTHAKGKFDFTDMRPMTLEEKVGQVFIVHVYGETPTDPNYENTNINGNRGGKNFKEIIEKYHVGGIIYFNWSYNIGTPLVAEQVQDLSNGLQDIAAEQDNPIPLFISTDQEGGIVQRVTEPGTVFPGNMAIGATRSEQLAQESAGVLGKELRSLGINMNFAPTLDVNVNPANPVIGVRSFSESTDLVSQLGIAQIKGYQQENIIASAKHFPGHGDTDVDSHYGLPIIESDLETLHEVDLKPFKDAIDAGIDSIMSAHIVVPALDDSGMPATLSKPIMTDLLRHELGFDGLIITDSLGMSGANVVPADRVAVESFKAGADILLNPPNVEMAYNSLLQAVQSGEISEQRLDESVFRILKAKLDKGLFDNPFTDKELLKYIGAEEHLQLADDIADNSITLVKNDESILPLNTGDKVFVTGPSVGKPTLLSSLLQGKGIDSSSYATGTSPTTAEINAAVEHAENAEKVVVTSYTANTNAQQEALVKALQAADIPVIVTAIRNPYDLMVFPEVDAYLATYGDRDVSVHGLSRILTGEVNPTGTLPVAIPGLYDFGHGLTY